MAMGLKRILQADDMRTARAAYAVLTMALDGKAARARAGLAAGLEEAVAVLGLPEKYRVRLRTTNGIERLNEERRRRERVLRIFPNDASAVRLIGALWAEQHEVWSTGKRYFDMTEDFEWKAAQAPRAPGVLREVG